MSNIRNEALFYFGPVNFFKYPWRLLFGFSLLTSAIVKAQDSIQPQKVLTYKLKLQHRNNESIKGYLKNITDSSIVYTTTKASFGSPPAPADKTIHYTDIAKVKVKRKGAAARGALFGALTGLGTGALIGLFEGDDPPGTFIAFSAGDKAIIYGGMLALTGAIAGTITGAVAGKNHSIDGSKEKFAAMQQAFLAKMYRRTASGTSIP